MAAKKSDIKKPALRVEEVVIPEISSEPLLFRSVYQSTIDAAREQADIMKLPFYFALASVVVLDDDKEPIFDIQEWNTFHAGNHAAFDEVIRVVSRVCGMDREENKKKSRTANSA